MAEVWPATLQQSVNQANFQIVKQNTNIRTNVETGPIKSRRRFTNPQIQMTCQIWVPESEFATFETFYDTTLKNGSLTFDFDHPITGTTTEWRFVSPPVFTALGGLNYILDMAWESI